MYNTSHTSKVYNVICFYLHIHPWNHHQIQDGEHIVMFHDSQVGKKWIGFLRCCSVAKLCMTLRDPHGLQHARLPCPSPSPEVCPSSCPLTWWCHSTISSSVAPFSFCLQSFPASQSFPVSWLFTSGGQNIGTVKEKKKNQPYLMPGRLEILY